MRRRNYILKRIKTAGVTAVVLVLLCSSGIKQDKVKSTDCELSETLTGLTLKNMELHKEEVEKKALEERKRKAKEEKERIAAEEAELARLEQERQEAERAEMDRQAEEQAAQQTDEEVTYSSGGSVLTKSGGVNYYNGQKETYYSQRVLPGGGLDIPGRHVASDGTVRDVDGYIVVASDTQGKGETGSCSLGDYKVYDTGVGHDGVDVYTDW